MDWSIRGRIYAGVIVVIPVVIFAVLGVQGESLTSFLFQFMKYLKRRRVLTAPDGKYRLKRNRRLQKQRMKSQRGGGNHGKRSKRVKTKTTGSESGRKTKRKGRKTAPQGAAEI